MSFLLLAVLTMVSAEVFSGSAPLWFIDPWALLVTVPLYALHVVVLWSLAVHIRRTHWIQLYGLGIVLALYESWITKVLWAGYVGEDGVLVGTFLGVGVAEFLVLVLWWHPVFSFILPLYAYERLTAATERIIQVPRWLERFGWMSLGGAGAMVAFSHDFNPVTAVVTLLGSGLLVLGIYRMSRARLVPLQHFTCKGKKWWLLGAGLLVAYSLGMALILPERLPLTVVPYLSIIVWYGIAAWLVLGAYPAVTATETPGTLRRKGLLTVTAFILFMVGALLAPGAGAVMVAIWYWLLAGFGLITLAVAVRAVIR